MRFHANTEMPYALMNLLYKSTGELQLLKGFTVCFPCILIQRFKQSPMHILYYRAAFGISSNLSESFVCVCVLSEQKRRSRACWTGFSFLLVCRSSDFEAESKCGSLAQSSTV